METMDTYNYFCFALIALTGIPGIVFGVMMESTDEIDEAYKYRRRFKKAFLFCILNVAFQLLLVIGNVVAAVIKMFSTI